MSTPVSHFSLIALSLIPVGYAAAQARCDCTAIVDSCRADVSIQGSWVEVSSDHQQCSRVDYFIDGLPFVAVVVDGVQRQDWIARVAPPQILVQSCQVCRDNAQAGTPVTAPVDTPAGASATDTAATEFSALIEVAPQYPAAAQAQGLEGHVDLSFTVSPFGTVEAATVTAAEPPGVFDQAALAAIRRWRFPADAERAPLNLSERMNFSLAGSARRRDTLAALPRAERGPRNECLREQAVYNYGEMIEVDLINACTDPLLVYSCAAGTGRYLGQWVCTDAERTLRLLTPLGDRVSSALAATEAPGPTREFGYVGTVSVARAPNTQYWWLACRQGDANCRDDARQWVRSLDRQLISVDPQSRTSLSVARSY
jgi:TonB family protein